MQYSLAKNAMQKIRTLSRGEQAKVKMCLLMNVVRYMMTAFKKGLALSLYGTILRSYIESEGGVAY